MDLSQDKSIEFECLLHGCLHDNKLNDILEKAVAIWGYDKQKNIYEHEIVCLPSFGRFLSEVYKSKLLKFYYYSS
jgi:hypothetical protein